MKIAVGIWLAIAAPCVLMLLAAVGMLGFWLLVAER
jgi:hypothetical protein